MVEEKNIDFSDDTSAIFCKMDEATLAAIDRGIKSADEGRLVPIDEVRRMVQQWSTKSTLLEKP